MQDISFSLTAVVLLALIALLVAAVAAPVEIVGTLQNVRAVPRSGEIMVIQETPYMIFTTYEVEEDGWFRFTRDSEGAPVIPAQSKRHPPAERLIPAGSIGIVTVNFVLPLGQNVEVRVVDADRRASEDGDELVLCESVFMVSPLDCFLIGLPPWAWH